METISFELQNKIIRKILQINDVDILNKLAKFLYQEKNIYVFEDFEKTVIQESKEEIQNGQFFSHDVFFNDIEAWLNEK